MFIMCSLPMRHRKTGHLVQRPPEASSRLCAEASYMAETAVALPFFAGFLAVLLFFFQALCAQQEIGGALLSAGRELSVLECDAGRSSGAGRLAAKTVFLKHLKEDSAAGRFVKGGRLGISLAESELSGDYICLRADYRLPLPFGLFGRQAVSFRQQAACRKWTGADYGKEDEIVYIAKSGSVYHIDRACSYLSPSVSPTDAGEVERKRNASGAKYYPCAKCMKGKPKKGIVYITRHGSRYHGKKDCGEIKRTAVAVRLDCVKNRKACSKCGREGKG